FESCLPDTLKGSEWLRFRLGSSGPFGVSRLVGNTRRRNRGQAAQKAGAPEADSTLVAARRTRRGSPAAMPTAARRAGFMSHPSRPLLVDDHSRPRGLFAEALLLLVGELLRFENYENLLQGARERKRHLVDVVLDNRRAGVLADVERLIERESDRQRPRN